MIATHGIPATPWQRRSLEQGQLKAIALPLLPEPMKVGRHLWVLRCRPADLFWGDSEAPSKKLLKKLKHQKGDRIYLQERWCKGDWGAAFDGQ
jgi:hypothetical protein